MGFVIIICTRRPTILNSRLPIYVCTYIVLLTTVHNIIITSLDDPNACLLLHLDLFLVLSPDYLDDL